MLCVYISYPIEIKVENSFLLDVHWLHVLVFGGKFIFNSIFSAFVILWLMHIQETIGCGVARSQSNRFYTKNFAKTCILGDIVNYWAIWIEVTILNAVIDIDLVKRVKNCPRKWRLKISIFFWFSRYFENTEFSFFFWC